MTDETLTSLDSSNPGRSLWSWARVSIALRLADGFADLEHDLRSPLHSMLMAIDLLERDAPGDGARRLVAGASKRVERLLGSLQFPDFGRSGSAPLSLRQAVEASVASWPVHRALGRVEPLLDLPNDLPAVTGNETALAIALLQLLCNAGEALDDADDGTLSITARLIAGRVVVEIRDNGPGMGAADGERIFDWFYTGRGGGGHIGIGLPLARGLLERFGGVLSVTAAESRGTVATIGLPVVG